MPKTVDYDQLTEKLQAELARFWDEYQHAPPEEKAAARQRYLAALRQFSSHVNPG
jgi:hypothetical protein